MNLTPSYMMQSSFHTHTHALNFYRLSLQNMRLSLSVWILQEISELMMFRNVKMRKNVRMQISDGEEEGSCTQRRQIQVCLNPNIRVYTRLQQTRRHPWLHPHSGQENREENLRNLEKQKRNQRGRKACVLLRHLWCTAKQNTVISAASLFASGSASCTWKEKFPQLGRVSKIVEGQMQRKWWNIAMLNIWVIILFAWGLKSLAAPSSADERLKVKVGRIGERLSVGRFFDLKQYKVENELWVDVGNTAAHRFYH